ncbi:transcriptional regulatory protein [Exophiala viscosa]|uniref:Transcriptional regulatory protein n=1 Tax=Exophiala viscosa TaxID=2486360 RepID=A0AAN6E6N2_9EURO|nr:transcriptional regulatory protein [Exophiala viscosa]KAI1628120.1 transcriptional regulatory protein [Exophiala viscosa]
MHNQVKRKTSVAGLTTGGRTVKRRASKACHCCRSRKVRCDVVEGGIPCTNCRLDEVECVVTEGKRRRKSCAEGELFHQSPCNSIQEETEPPQFPIFDDIDGLNDFAPALSSVEPGQNLHALEFELSHHRPHMLYQTQGHRLSREERTRRMSAISTRPHPTPAQLPTGMSYFPQQSPRPEIALPPFIKPISPRLASEDLEYLQKKGAFIVPEPGLRNELLRCYVQYVHPYLPLIDLQDFLGTVQKDQPTDTVSLLLFQAVMFAATAYIDMRYLVAQGYMTRKAARKSFFQRVKLLYDFDYEIDRVTVVQGVLLMTYWYENPDDPKDVWHWLGVAISVARTIGLNCDTSNAPLMSMQQRRLWKRIWWCCFMRDRLIAIGMRRPMRINKGDFDVPMLGLSDFETEPLPTELTRLLGGCPAVKDISTRVTLAKMCMALADLCMCITQVLAVQYSTLGHKIGATQETTMRLVPKKSAADPCDVIRCDGELEEWYKNLSPSLRFFAPGSRDCPSTNDGDIINLHRALLTGIYLTAVSALHRPQILPSAPTVVVAPELRELSKRKVREAADDITNMYRDLFAHDLIRFLPNTGVTCLLPAIIIHLLDIKSTDAAVRQASIRKFQFCMQALQRLREMYASADFSFSFLDAAVRKTNCQLSAATIATAASDNKEQFSNSGSPFEHKPFPSGPLLLTPPPEAMQTAKLLLFSSTLAPEERNLLSAFTPPGSAGSEASLHSYNTGGAAAGLREIHQEDELDYKGADEPQQELTQLDFESLVNLEGGSDLFSSVEDDMDMNLQWLNGFDAGDLDMNSEEHTFGKDHAGVGIDGSGYAEQPANVTLVA